MHCFYQLRRMKYFVRIVLAATLALNLSCKEKENVIPTCEILAPADGDKVMQGDQVTVSVVAEDSDGTIVEIELFIGGVEMGRTEGSSYEYIWNTDDNLEGGYIITAVARDDRGGGIADNITLLVDVTGGFNPDLSYGKVADYDGNSYATLEVGEQTWMAENLRVTHHADGSAIPLVNDDAAWEMLEPTAKAYCWFENQTGNGDVYGGLYTWAAANQGVCPDGWHLPGDAEWKELEMFLGMTQVQADKPDWRGTDEGGQIKERGFTHWEAPNTGGNNSSGITVIPGGFRSPKGGFYSLGIDATFWTADEELTTDKAWYRAINFEKERVYRHYNEKNQGLSVRCVKDLI